MTPPAINSRKPAPTFINPDRSVITGTIRRVSELQYLTKEERENLLRATTSLITRSEAQDKTKSIAVIEVMTVVAPRKPPRVAVEGDIGVANPTPEAPTPEPLKQVSLDVPVVSLTHHCLRGQRRVWKKPKKRRPVWFTNGRTDMRITTDQIPPNGWWKGRTWIRGRNISHRRRV